MKVNELTPNQALWYLLGALDFLHTGKTFVADPKLFALAEKAGAVKVAGGYDLSLLLNRSAESKGYEFPQEFLQKLNYFVEQGRATYQPVDRVLDYFDRIRKKLSKGTFKPSDFAELFYAVWAVYTLNFSAEIGRMAQVKEKKFAETILRKGNKKEIVNAAINYILAGKDPNIWFFNNDLPKFLIRKAQQTPKKSW